MISCTNSAMLFIQTEHVTYYILRLCPGRDLGKEIDKFISDSERSIRAGVMVTCVGSLQEVRIRLANAQQKVSYKDKFEIVSLVGTLGIERFHLYLSVSDSAGKTIRGH